MGAIVTDSLEIMVSHRNQRSGFVQNSDKQIHVVFKDESRTKHKNSKEL